MAVVFAMFIIILIYLSCKWLMKKYKYWSNKKIVGPKPWPVVGNIGPVLLSKEHTDDFLHRLYYDFPNEQYIGIYIGLKPALVIKDPNMVKKVLIEDFSYFQTRGIKNAHPLNDNIFMSEGDTWKILRSKLTSTFTSKKLKDMIPLIEKCADDLIVYVDELLNITSDHEVHYNLIPKFTALVTGSCFFGVNLKTFNEDKSDFKHITDVIHSPNTLSRYVLRANMIIPRFQKIANLLQIDPRINNTVSFFKKFVKKMIKERDGHINTNKDFMDLIIDMKRQNILKQQSKNKTIEMKVTNNLLLAQVYVYTMAMEAPSALTSVLLRELAFRHDIQDLVYKEICDISKKYKGKITYSSLNEMVYLEMVVNEVLRKYSSSTIQRKAVTDYNFPGNKLKIDKGTLIMIPVKGLNMDPKYFDNPDKFNPERWLPENKRNLPQGAFLPFGDGPRGCIAERAAKLIMKYGVTAFLKRYKVDTCDRTEKNLCFDPTAIIFKRAKQGIWLNISKRTNISLRENAVRI